MNSQLQDSQENEASTSNTAMSMLGMDEAELFDAFYAMDEQQQEIYKLEKDIEVAEEYVALGKALKRLEENEDFKKVIEENFIADVPKRMAKALGGSPKPEAEKDFIKAISGVGVLEHHLEGIMQFAVRAQMELPLMKAQLVELKSDTSEDDDE